MRRLMQERHRLAIHPALRPFLQCRHQIGGHQRRGAGIANQGFEGGPLGFQLFPCWFALRLRDFLEFGIKTQATAAAFRESLEMRLS